MLGEDDIQMSEAQEVQGHLEAGTGGKGKERAVEQAKKGDPNKPPESSEIEVWLQQERVQMGLDDDGQEQPQETGNIYLPTCNPLSKAKFRDTDLSFGNTI